MILEAHRLVRFFGLFGDTLTFVGSLILAIDAAQQEKRFKTIRNRVKTYLSPEFLRLKIEVEGVNVTDEKDIELPFIRHSAFLAKIGSALLTVGFAFLLLHRIVELYQS